ncbi:MAG: hypothetical protein UX10_C0019G0010 [Candidatus Magasanikbacteria bacterium GW2011_GWA2_45_39]|uniref:Uncharacterized protein n=1 Tax=Candidatus Magasanikbacteria bacterium GW2011_GWA2_45_39 TaxID=1619041 RepID=A0A0G1MF03_9BACT|nr:MAG: hypothetical protein UX10_C0019G0010 [Candidatus Magasanikbacteria bacterium GW2011_GWA2_45_39]
MLSCFSFGVREVSRRRIAKVPACAPVPQPPVFKQRHECMFHGNSGGDHGQIGSEHNVHPCVADQAITDGGKIAQLVASRMPPAHNEPMRQRIKLNGVDIHARQFFYRNVCQHPNRLVPSAELHDHAKHTRDKVYRVRRYQSISAVWYCLTQRIQCCFALFLIPKRGKINAVGKDLADQCRKILCRLFLQEMRNGREVSLPVPVFLGGEKNGVLCPAYQLFQMQPVHVCPPLRTACACN